MAIETVIGEVMWVYPDDTYLLAFWTDMDAYLHHQFFYVFDGKRHEQRYEVPEWHLTPASTWYVFYDRRYDITWLNTPEQAFRAGDRVSIPQYAGKPRDGVLTICNGTGDILHFTYEVPYLKQHPIYLDMNPASKTERGVMGYREVTKRT
jgi:hypothetical protein